MPELVIVDPEGEQRRLRLEANEYYIGRDRSMTLVLADPKISRRHARVVRLGHGAYCIEDLDSANGVTVNGQKITAPRQLAHGHHIELGDFRLTYCTHQPAQALFVLKGVTGPDAHESISLGAGAHEVGRADDNAVVVRQASVSRRHARLEVSAAGVTVQDLGSSNGTFVGERRVGVTGTPLKPGQRLRLGSAEWVLLWGPATPFWGRPWATTWAWLRGSDATLKGALGMGALSGVLLVLLVAAVTHRPAATPVATGAASAAAQLEQAYQREVEQGVSRGMEALHRAAWQEAAALFSEVLVRDPGNHEARRGLLAAQDNEKHAAALQQAQLALQQGRPEEALYLLRNIPGSSRYGQEASARRGQALAVAQQAALEAARQACRRGAYPACHQAAIKYVAAALAAGTQLGSDVGAHAALALQAYAEEAMRLAGQPFTVWTWPPASAPLADGRELVALYPEAALRLVVFAYASDELEMALQEAARLARQAGDSATGRRARELTQKMGAVRTKRRQAEQAEQRRQLQAAVDLWQSVLELDAQLVPRAHANALGHSARTHLARAHYDLGEAAFQRAAYSAAALAWRAAYELDPANAAITEALHTLEERAEALLNGLGHSRPPDGAACGRLREILAMTDPTQSKAHGEARLLLAECPP